MRKLHSLAFYAMAAPAIALSSGAVLAERSTGTDFDRDQQNTQRDRGAMDSSPGTTTRDEGSQRTDQSDSRSTTDRQDYSDNSDTKNRNYMSSAPVNGTQASDLLGASVVTNDGEDVGSVDDLIIDDKGQIVAVTVGAGGFLGIGQKNVAIGWDNITQSGDSDDLELRVNLTPDDLRNAPEFERRD